MRMDWILGKPKAAEQTTLLSVKDTVEDLDLELDGVAKETTSQAIKEVVDEIDLDTNGIAQEATLLLVKNETDKISRVLGLSQENFRIFSPVYDKWGNLISSIIKLYSSKIDCDNNVNIIAEYTQTATFNQTLMTGYKVVRNI